MTGAIPQKCDAGPIPIGDALPVSLSVAPNVLERHSAFAQLREPGKGRNGKEPAG
jgi:hypothetical protein